MVETDLVGEFNLRYYWWSISECEAEFANNFPILRSFSRGINRRKYQCLSRMAADDQRRYIRAKLRESHRSAALQLGETTSPVDGELLEKVRHFVITESDMDPPDVERGKRVGFAKKPALRKVMAGQFADAFSKDCYEMVSRDVDGNSRFCMRFNNWEVQTSFWYGRQHPLINVTHAIVSQERVQHAENPEITGPACILGLMAWTGLFQLQWEYLFPGEVEESCNTAISICQKTFLALPGLLDGLVFT